MKYRNAEDCKACYAQINNFECMDIFKLKRKECPCAKCIIATVCEGKDCKKYESFIDFLADNGY